MSMTKTMSEIMGEMTAEDMAWMEANWKGVRDQVFTHVSHDTGEIRHINVSELIRQMDAGKIAGSHRFMAIDDDLYRQVLEQQGIERGHLRNITFDQAAYDPTIILEIMEDGATNHVIIDGNHKLVKAYEMGLRCRPAIFLSPEQVEPFLVHPPERVSRLMVAATVANEQIQVLT